MKEGGFAVALVTNQAEGIAKLIAPVKAITHPFFQKITKFRKLTGKNVQRVIQKFLT